jgi:hypothetical protein
MSSPSLTPSSERGSQLLQAASQGNWSEILTIFKNKQDEDYFQTLTTVHVAIQNRHWDIVRRLVTELKVALDVKDQQQL